MRLKILTHALRRLKINHFQALLINWLLVYSTNQLLEHLRTFILHYINILHYYYF